MGLLAKANQAMAGYIYRQIKPFLREATPQGVVSGMSYPSERQDTFANWNEEIFERMGVTDPIAKGCIDFRVSSIMSDQLDMEERDSDNPDGWNRVAGHEFERMVNTKPLAGVSGEAAWKKQLTWLYLRGEMYWMIVKNKPGDMVLNMIPIPAYMMTPIPWKVEDGGEVRQISYYVYTPRDPRYPEYLPWDSVYFVGLPNPFSSVRGLSPLATYLTMLKLGYEADKFDLDDYIKGLTTGALIFLRPDINQRDFLSFQSDFNMAIQSGHRYKYFRASDVDVKQLEIERGEAGQNVQKRREHFANLVWGIPDAVRNPEGANRSISEVAYEVYEKETIRPSQKLISQELTGQVVWPVYGEDFRVVYHLDEQVDIDAEVKQDENRRKDMTYNEMRESKGLDPHPDDRVGLAPATSAGKVYEIITLQGMQIEEPELEEENLEEDVLDKAVKPFKPKGKLLPEGEPEQELIEDIEDYLTEWDKRQSEYRGMLS